MPKYVIYKNEYASLFRALGHAAIRASLNIDKFEISTFIVNIETNSQHRTIQSSSRNRFVIDIKTGITFIDFNAGHNGKYEKSEQSKFFIPTIKIFMI